MQGTNSNLTLSEAAKMAMESQLNQGLSTAQKTSRLIQTLSGENLVSSQTDLNSLQSTERRDLESSAPQSPKESKAADAPQSMSESVSDLMDAFSISEQQAERLMDIT